MVIVSSFSFEAEFHRLSMEDPNEEFQADEELPALAEDRFEQLENGFPAERSGHVAVSDGHCMFVWGGYKVSHLLLFCPCDLSSWSKIGTEEEVATRVASVHRGLEKQ